SQRPSPSRKTAATTGMNVGLFSNRGPLINLSLGFCCEKLGLGRNGGGITMQAVNIFKQLLQDERGATAIEYGLILALVCLAIIGAVRGVADANTGMWAVVE